MCEQLKLVNKIKAFCFQKAFNLLVPGAGIEPAQPQWLQDFKSSASTNSAIRATKKRARDGTRTRDPNLGKVVLYQLSYSRIILSEHQATLGLQLRVQI